MSLAHQSASATAGQKPSPLRPERSHPPPGPLGLADRLEKLAALHERGVLPDAEFAKAKALQLGL